MKSFNSFAYDGPGPKPIHQTITPPAPWQIEATVPQHGIDGYAAYGWLLNVGVTRSVNGHQEIWLSGLLLPNDHVSGNTTIFYVYTPETQKWEIIPGAIGDTGLFTQGLFVTKDGAIWSQTIWDSMAGHPTLNNVPILSRFNESTRRFELATGALEIPLVVGKQYASWPKIVLDAQNVFWLFADNDGIYRYDSATQITDKWADLPDVLVTDTALSTDGSIYFRKEQYQTGFRLQKDELFQFLPETGKILPVDVPDNEWPTFSGLLVDHTGRLWLGSTGYRALDGTWHLIMPHPQEFFDHTDGYLWSNPRLTFESSDGLLWYYRYLDTEGWAEGTAWYDPNTGEGCLFTNQPANIVEAAGHQLWLAADGKLYQRSLKP